MAPFLTASGGGNPCYEQILDALSLRKVESVKTFRNSETLAEELLKLGNRDSSVVTLPLSDDRLRHSELSEESLKHHSLSVGEGAVVLAKASYKCEEGAYPMEKGGLNYA